MLTVRRLLRSSVVVCVIGLALPAAPARAYAVDCAILLCLAGGWPMSPVCQHAKVVFVTRLTPWPVEPPLQLWRCPMGGGRSADALSSVGGTAPKPGEGLPAADVIGSIRVHHVRFTQRTTGGGGMGRECQRDDRTEVGGYDEAGSFRWKEGVAAAVPSGPGLSRFDPPPNCRTYRYRAVAVSWTDALGQRGFKEVRY